MGCWNKTCGISQFPIIAGQKTVSFVIIENERMGGFAETQPCYHNPYWDFVPLPIYGEYNDYGAQEDDPGQEYKYEVLREFYKGRIVEVRGEVSYGEKVENPFANGKSLGTSVHDQLFGINTSGYGKKEGQEYVNIATMMIDRKLFDTLTASVTLGDYRYDHSSARIFTKEDMCNIIRDYKEFEEKLLNDPAEEMIKSFGRMMWGDKFNKINFGDSGYYDIRPILVRYFTGMSGFNSFITSDFFREVGDKMQPLDVVDAYMFQYLLNSLRKQVIPQTHEGSQSDIEDIHQKYVNALQTCIDDRNAMFGEDEE